MKKEMTLVYGDSLIIYCFGGLSRMETMARLEGAISNVANSDIRTQMMNLQDKISEDMDDADWAEIFSKILRTMAVYLDREKEIFQKCLEKMMREKDNINSIFEVDQIRNNTFLLMHYLLGGINFSKSGDAIHQLGITTISFFKMYQAIMQYGCGNYYLLQFNEDERILVALPEKQESPYYDKSGTLINTRLRFVKIDRKFEEDWHNEDWWDIEMEFFTDRIVYLRPDNMPTAIYYVDKATNSVVSISW